MRTSNMVAAKLQERIAEQRSAIETFARLHRELAEMKDEVLVPEAVDRVDSLLKLNAEYMQALREELAISLSLLRGTHVVPACAASAD